MTKAVLYCRSGQLQGFLLEGHAGWGESGKDIVCSALSAITHMTAIGITEVMTLRAQVFTEEKAGRMRLILHPEDVSKAQVLLRAMELELGCIAEQYPGHLRVIYEERREFKCFS
ncbi:MAG: ribosomal-processing cysteine protease Prp [Clostridiales bacterium]|nr:ribosomal-processing cysteine protease Prp [Bacillota bacterium]NLL54610.1 ribosomal-processing cysteine protease Prp [Clostridiales bacterium]